MKRSHSLGLLLIAIGLLAMLSVPSIAAAKQRDRNHDGIPDRWEKRHRLSLRDNQARRDQDRDRLRNRAEFLAGTNPRNADSDGNCSGSRSWERTDSAVDTACGNETRTPSALRAWNHSSGTFSWVKKSVPPIRA